MNAFALSFLRRAGVAHAACLLLLLLAVLALYGPYLSNPFVFDDLHYFQRDLNGVVPISQKTFNWWQLRALPEATLAWGLALSGIDLPSFRIVNLLLHFAIASVLYGLVLQLRSIHGAVQVAADRYIACVAALLFALHPVAVYGVGYLAQRSTLMATLFGLLAVSAYVRGSMQHDARYVWFSVLLYHLALFSKEHVLALVLVFPLLTVFLQPDWRMRLRGYWWPWLVMLLSALWAVYLRRHVLGESYEKGAMLLLGQIGLEHPWRSSVLTQSLLFFKYLGLWLLPNTAWLSVDIREPLAQSWQSPYLFALALYCLWGAVGLALLLRRGRRGLAGLAMLFPWLLFWTELASVRVQEPFVLYRSYLWMAGGVCFAAATPPASVLRHRALWLLVVVFAVVSFGMSIDRLRSFSHPLILWDDAEKLVHGRSDLPGAAWIYYNRGVHNIRMQRWASAIEDLQQAVALQEDFPSAYGNLGACYLFVGAWEQARREFSRALDWHDKTNQPGTALFHHGRATAYEHLKMPERAREDYRLACQLGRLGCENVEPDAW